MKKSFGGDTYIKIVQKRVDMLMGIDMATYSFNLNPLEILLMCNDQDILPALKMRVFEKSSRHRTKLPSWIG